MDIFLIHRIEQLKKDFESSWNPCELCTKEGTPGVYNFSTCKCILEKRRILKQINSGLPLDLIDIPEKDILDLPFYSKIESLIKRPNSFIDFGLGLFLYGEMNIGKTKILSKFFSECIMSSTKVNGMFFNFTELVEILRRRRMSNDIATQLDNLIDKDIILIDGIHDDIEDRLYPDLIQILDQIFLRRSSALLMTADNIYGQEQTRFPRALKEFLFSTNKIRPLSIRSKRNKSNQWDGRIYNERGRRN